MKVRDATRFAFDALRGYRTRTLLMLLAMSIGVASVLVLTSLGEAARRYVTGEFSSLGTNLIIVLPGKSETIGGGPAGFFTDTPRDLTLNDALAVSRSSLVRHMAPINVGAAPISARGLERDITIVGSSAALMKVRHLELTRGRFLPEGDIDRADFVTVLGGELKQDLFGAQNALGEWVRIGDRRFRVIGIMASEGRTFDIDTANVAFIPVAAAQMLFNTASLFRILVDARSREALPRAIEHVRNTLRERHQGEEDVTIITQDAVLDTFDRVFNALTLTVAGIASISLAVAGILIMNVMLVAVSQRTTEIGLLKALGAPRRQIVQLIMTEAALLSMLGAGLGVLIGQLGNGVIGYFYPALPVGAPWWAFVASIGVALGTGLLFSLLPARRAARLDPVQALARH
ncbi:MAG: ABC transporter permease [Gammaproteobacteria bacterium]|nr:ABC transporter permease [Gammaproteobacteria bacterium]